MRLYPSLHHLSVNVPRIVHPECPESPLEQICTNCGSEDRLAATFGFDSIGGQLLFFFHWTDWGSPLVLRYRVACCPKTLILEAFRDTRYVAPINSGDCKKFRINYRRETFSSPARASVQCLWCAPCTCMFRRHRLVSWWCTGECQVRQTSPRTPCNQSPPSLHQRQQDGYLYS